MSWGLIEYARILASISSPTDEPEFSNRGTRGKTRKQSRLGEDPPIDLRVGIAAEVDQQPKCHPACLQVVKKLGLVLRGDCLDGLRFDDNLPPADEVWLLGLEQGLSHVDQFEFSLRKIE